MIFWIIFTVLSYSCQANKIYLSSDWAQDFIEMIDEAHSRGLAVYRFESD